MRVAEKAMAISPCFAVIELIKKWQGKNSAVRTMGKLSEITGLSKGWLSQFMGGDIRNPGYDRVVTLVRAVTDKDDDLSLAVKAVFPHLSDSNEIMRKKGLPYDDGLEALLTEDENMLHARLIISGYGAEEETLLRAGEKVLEAARKLRDLGYVRIEGDLFRCRPIAFRKRATSKAVVALANKLLGDTGRVKTWSGKVSLEGWDEVHQLQKQFLKDVSAVIKRDEEKEGSDKMPVTVTTTLAHLSPV